MGGICACVKHVKLPTGFNSNIWYPCGMTSHRRPPHIIYLACEQAPGLEERSKFIGRREAPATRCKAPRKALPRHFAPRCPFLGASRRPINLLHSSKLVAGASHRPINLLRSSKLGACLQAKIYRTDLTSQVIV